MIVRISFTLEDFKKVSQMPSLLSSLRAGEKIEWTGLDNEKRTLMSYSDDDSAGTDRDITVYFEQDVKGKLPDWVKSIAYSVNCRVAIQSASELSIVQRGNELSIKSNSIELLRNVKYAIEHLR